jgi:hypothetical protein
MGKAQGEKWGVKGPRGEKSEVTQALSQSSAKVKVKVRSAEEPEVPPPLRCRGTQQTRR